MDIGQIVDARNIVLRMRARTKLEALEALAAKLYESGKIAERRGFLSDVLRREAEFSTGIGFGIAIPHAKSRYVNTASIAIGRLARAIPYGAAGEEPVDVLLMIAVPEREESAHLKILQRLSRSIMDEAFRARLREAADTETVLDILAKV